MAWNDLCLTKKKSSNVLLVWGALSLVLFTIAQVSIFYNLVFREERPIVFFRMQTPTINNEIYKVTENSETLKPDQLTISATETHVFIGSWKNTLRPSEGLVVPVEKSNYEASVFKILNEHPQASIWGEQNAILFVLNDKMDLKNVYDLTYQARYALSKLKEQKTHQVIDPNKISVSFFRAGAVLRQ